MCISKKIMNLNDVEAAKVSIINPRMVSVSNRVHFIRSCEFYSQAGDENYALQKRQGKLIGTTTFI